jgi:hypothetical protein
MSQKKYTKDDLIEAIMLGRQGSIVHVVPGTAQFCFEHDVDDIVESFKEKYQGDAKREYEESTDDSWHGDS